jgi:hypothetical protein
VGVTGAWLGVGVTGRGVGVTAAMVRIIASAVTAASVSTAAESFFAGSSCAFEPQALIRSEKARMSVSNSVIFFKAIPPSAIHMEETFHYKSSFLPPDIFNFLSITALAPIRVKFALCIDVVQGFLVSCEVAIIEPRLNYNENDPRV